VSVHRLSSHELSLLSYTSDALFAPSFDSSLFLLCAWAVYGLAHYSAAPPSKEYPFWRDTLKASNKDMGSNLRNFESMGKSTLPGSI